MIVGKPAPEFTLRDQRGVDFKLKDALTQSHLMLAFYPGDFTPVCTKQMCNYRDHLTAFVDNGVKICGISANNVESHAAFSKKYHLDFPLLADSDRAVAKAYGCTSLLMLGGLSRAVFIVSKKGFILYRYVEPTVITRRKAEELVGILGDLKKNGLLG